MTSRMERISPRKRILLVVFLSTFILTTAWISYFLVNFDLNNYRQQTEETLSSLLSLTVSIGEVHFNFHDTNLALHITALNIGDESSAIQIKAPDILLNLKWRGLIARQFAFTKISLMKPEVWVRTALGDKSGKQLPSSEMRPLMIDQALLHKIAINTLEVFEGTTHIELSRPGQDIKRIDFTKLDGEVSDIRLNQSSQLIVRGLLNTPAQKEKTPWQLQGESSLLLDDSKGFSTKIDLDLTMKGVDLGEMASIFAAQPTGYSIEGQGDLHLHIAGEPEDHIDFQSELSSEKAKVFSEAQGIKPATFKNLMVSGSLQTSQSHPGVDDLIFQLDESRLAGDISWSPVGQPFTANISLNNSNLKISQIKPWLALGSQSWSEAFKELQAQGSVQIELAEFSLREEADSKKNLKIGKLRGELTGAAWALGEYPTAEIISLPFSFSDDFWQFDKGQGKLGALQFVVDGTVRGSGSSLSTSFKITGDLLTDRVKEEWPQIPETPFSTHGRIGFSGTLEGPLKELKFDLQTDLSQVKVTVTQLDELTLAPGPGDKLTLSGTISPQRISLDHGAFKWNILKGHASGSYATEGSEKATYRALLIVEDLTRLEEILPLLGKFQIKGQAELDVDQQGLENNNRPEMTLTLRNGGLHATRFIADLSQINGRIKVTENGLAGNNLQVHLGQSPVIVQARLEDLSNPRLILDAKAPAVRADDLIFYSDKAKLRDVDGHLEIDRDGLLFAPVNVRLDGGTDASVRGTISFHPPYDVELDITSGFTNVSEVIGLWADRPVVKEQKPVPEEEKKSEAPPRTTIRINALSQAGDLYGMEFHDASAAIIPTRGQLLIHPLDFSVGEGFCNAQVIVDFPESAPTRLRVSGHAEDVDALKVYQDLLNQKNIVRGKLRGDFYLTGELGSRFIPTSRGNFSIAMREGVLHQFQILSKIFSLLNVSQLFAFQMPDMDLEGMPFDTLSANLQLEDGILKSEDLRIRSRAMNQSYVGQLDLVTREVDLSVAIQPLGTVDKIVSSIPIAGWLLTGDDGALLTAYFSVKGNRDNVSVQTMPLGTLSGPTMGLLKRTLGLPFKLIEDPQILWGGDGSK